MGFDKVVLNNPYDTFTSPLRPDPRPMYGIFHALLVLKRLDYLFKKIGFETYSELKFSTEKVQKELLEAIKVLEENTKLTKKGKLLFENIKNY